MPHLCVVKMYSNCSNCSKQNFNDYIATFFVQQSHFKSLMALTVGFVVQGLKPLVGVILRLRRGGQMQSYGSMRHLIISICTGGEMAVRSVFDKSTLFYFDTLGVMSQSAPHTCFVPFQIFAFFSTKTLCRAKNK